VLGSKPAEVEDERLRRDVERVDIVKQGSEQVGRDRHLAPSPTLRLLDLVRLAVGRVLLPRPGDDLADPDMLGIRSGGIHKIDGAQARYALVPEAGVEGEIAK
jgi:hypothetical protein